MLVLTRHYLARTWISGLLVSAGLCGFQVLICRVFQQVTPSGTANPFARFMPKWIQTAFNVDPNALSSITGFLAVAWQHPFVLIALLGMGVAHASGLLAGGVENRTLALLLARPVSRLRLVATAGFVLEFWAAVAVLSMVAGSRLGFRLMHIESPPADEQLTAAALNLWLLASAFGGTALAFSAFLNHRADAAGWGVTIVLIMYVWNFLAQLWTMAGSVPNFSLFHLFSPADIFLRGHIDPLHLFALAGVAAVGHGTAALIFRFRNFSV
jgi:ABC-2 type transport system permease protein